MNHALVSSVCSLLWLATPAKAFHGKHLTLVEKNASATQVIEQIVEVAHLSVIFVGHPEATLDLDAKNLPWDQVLDEVIARAKFKAERSGSVLVVSPVDFVRSPERPTYRGRRVTAAFRQLEPRVTVELLARAAEVQVPTVGGGDPVSFSLRNVPTDQLFDLVVEVSGAKPSAAKAPALEALPVPPKCVADATPLAELRLTGFVTGVATPYASVTDAQGHSFIVGRAQCLGTEGATVKAISTGRLLLRRGAEDSTLEWDPS